MALIRSPEYQDNLDMIYFELARQIINIIKLQGA